jgi:hypothetical protein
VNPKLDGFNVIRCQAVLVAELDAAVDARMNHHTAGKGFIAVLHDEKLFAEAVANKAEILFGGEGIGPAAFGLDALLGTGKAFAGQHGREQSVFGGVAHMKTFAHGAEHLAQSRRLGGGESKCPSRLLRRVAEQAAGCRRRAENSGGA